jgi:hypothetical protein
MGLKGIVSKRLGSHYRSGRSPDWLKFKNPHARGRMQEPIHSRSPEALFLGLLSARLVAPDAATWQS